jgi:hypothetical protein
MAHCIASTQAHFLESKGSVEADLLLHGASVSLPAWSTRMIPTRAPSHATQTLPASMCSRT